MNEDPLDAIPPLDTEQAAAYDQGLALRSDAEDRRPGWVQRCITVALETAHPFPRGEARIALQSAPAADVVAALLPPLTSENRRLRRRAMTLLPRLDAAELLRQMAAWLPTASKDGKRAACVVLAAVGGAATPLLQQLAADAEPVVQRRAQRALQVIADRDAGKLTRGDGGASPQRPKSYADSATRPFGLRPPPKGAPGAPLQRPRSFAVAAFNFSYGVNLGVLIRSAEAAGAEAVWIVGRDFYYRPSTKGTDWWIPVELLESPRACIDRAHREGFQIVALQQSDRAQSLFDADWPERPLIVVGNEGDGLPASFLDAADLQIEIPVTGQIDSLNVSVAASVAIYAFLGARARRTAPPP